MAVTDENLDRVHQARHALIKKYGGLDGWFRHLQAQDRRRRTIKHRTVKAAAKNRRRQKVRQK
jgi:hypothetical protein